MFTLLLDMDVMSTLHHSLNHCDWLIGLFAVCSQFLLFELNLLLFTVPGLMLVMKTVRAVGTRTEN